MITRGSSRLARTFVLATTLALFLAGCLEANQNRDTGRPGGGGGALPGVELTLTADRDQAAPGDSVVLRAVLRNHGTTPVYYDEDGCGPLRLKGAASPNGSEFPFETPRACAEFIKFTPLAPGATLERNYTWNVSTSTGAAESGAYRFLLTQRVYAADPAASPGEEVPSEVLEAEATVHVADTGPFNVRYEVTATPDPVSRTGQVTFHITATNLGTSTIYYLGEPAGCSNERTSTMLNAAGEPILFRAPVACLAWYKTSHETLAPGESFTWNLTWDLQVYDENAQNPQPAAPGEYTFVAGDVFHTAGPQRDQQGDVTRSITDRVSFTVTA